MLTIIMRVFGVAILAVNYPFAIYLLCQLKNIPESSHRFGKFLGVGNLVLSTLFALGAFYISCLV